MSKTTLYTVVDTTKVGSDYPVRLIDAASPAAAIQHCAKPRYVVNTATARDVAELMLKGVTIEKATKANGAAPGNAP